MADITFNADMWTIIMYTYLITGYNPRNPRTLVLGGSLKVQNVHKKWDKTFVLSLVIKQFCCLELINVDSCVIKC